MGSNNLYQIHFRNYGGRVMLRFWKNYLLKKARVTKSVKEQMRLVRHSDYEIREELFRNPDLHSLALEMLVHDDNEIVRAKIAKHLKDSDLIDEMILREESPRVLLRLAKNKNLSEEQQIDLLKKKDNYEVWVYLAGETTSFKIMKMCFETGDEEMKSNLAQNKDLEFSIAMQLAEEGSNTVCFCLACDTEYSEVLDYLADNVTDEDTLIEVALNSATHNKTLYKLSKNPNDWIRKAVASNERLSKRLRKKLSHDPSSIVREQLTKKDFYFYW